MRRLVTVLLSLFCVPLTAQPLDLSTAWNRICDYSPRLSIRSLDIEALEGDRCQASLYPNPEVGLQVDNFAGSNFYERCDNAELIVACAQPIVTAGKLDKRATAVDAAITEVEWEIEALKRDLRESLERQFALIAVLQERQRIANQNRNIANSALQATAQLSEIGKTSLYHQKKASIALRYADLALQKIHAELKQAMQDLVIQWGGCEPDFSEICFPLHDIAPPPCLDALLPTLDQTPQALFANATVCTAEKTLIAARAEWYPDVLLSVGYKAYRQHNDHALFVGLDIPIPLFNRNQGNIYKANALRCKAEYARVYAFNQAVAEIRGALARASTAYSRAKTIRDGLLRELQETHEMTLEGYNQGKLGYVDLLDSQRTLYASNEEYLDALLEYHLSMATIRRLTGTACYLTY